MIRALIAATIVVGCTGGAGDDDATVDAAGGDSPAAIDAAAARCNPALPFATPRPVTELNTPGVNDYTPFLTADELTILFASSRAGGVGNDDLYIATRTQVSDPFGVPALLNGVNTAASENRPTMTADGLTLYAQAIRGAQYDIVVANRASTAASFGAPMVVAQLSMPTDDTGPFILPDHSAIYLVQSTTGDPDVYRATHNGLSFDVPVAPTGSNLNSFATEDHPALTPDELTLVFGSSRTGGAGLRDIYIATRPSLVQGFGAPVGIAEVNTAAAESPGWLSADGCVLYFNRGSTAGFDIFVATRAM